MTKEIGLCGLGNALVDIEVRVPDSVLITLGLTKGTMTLVDSTTQGNVLSTLDGHEHHNSSGGSAANTIIAYGQFGGRAAYKTVLGNDKLGRFYANEFRELSIRLEADFVDEASTGTCLVLITPDAERTMLTCLGINQSFGVEHVVERTVARSEWLYVEGYKFSEPSGTEAIAEAIRYAKAHNTKIAVSFSDTFVVNVFRDSLEEVAGHADLVFCNETEALAFSGRETADEAFKWLRSRYPSVAMTRGGQGAWLWMEGSFFEIPAYHADPVDTTGAGDIFAAGLLYGITHGMSPAQSGHLGSLAAAKVVSQFGARLKSSPLDIRNQIVNTVKSEA